MAVSAHGPPPPTPCPQNRLLNVCLEAVRGGGCGVAHRFGGQATGDAAGAGTASPAAFSADAETAAAAEGGAAPPSPPPLPSQWASRDPAALPTTDTPLFGAQPCGAEDKAWQAAVWLTAHDDDELPFIRGSAPARADAAHHRSDCLTDWFGAFTPHGAVHMQWVAYGGHALAVHPPAGLVSELYTQRGTTAEATHKVAVNLPQARTEAFPALLSPSQ